MKNQLCWRSLLHKRWSADQFRNHKKIFSAIYFLQVWFLSKVLKFYTINPFHLSFEAMYIWIQSYSNNNLQCLWRIFVRGRDNVWSGMNLPPPPYECHWEITKTTLFSSSILLCYCYVFNNGMWRTMNLNWGDTFMLYYLSFARWFNDFRSDI